MFTATVMASDKSAQTGGGQEIKQREEYTAERCLGRTGGVNTDDLYFLIPWFCASLLLERDGSKQDKWRTPEKEEQSEG